MRSLQYALFGALLVVVSACSSSAQQAKQMAPSEVVATVASTSITLGEVDQRALQEPASAFGNARLVQALYLARRAALDELIAIQLMDREAAARGIDGATLVQREITGKVAPPTDADIAFWYQTNAARVQGATLEQVREPIRELLTEQRMDEAHRAFVAALKERTPVTISLEPPRQTVATDGRPAKGPKGAPVELVEFSDFQCPFCQAAYPTVMRVLAKYGDRIRLVYRHYPLPNHPSARPAAEASECAEAQGRFWPYHDHLFNNPNKLSDADLKAHAAATGLDVAAFNACFDARTHTARIEQDMKDGQQLGVAGTPAFFINGRALEGAQPFEAFVRVIDEELAAARK